MKKTKASQLSSMGARRNIGRMRTARLAVIDKKDALDTVLAGSDSSAQICQDLSQTSQNAVYFAQARKTPINAINFGHSPFWFLDRRSHRHFGEPYRA